MPEYLKRTRRSFATVFNTKGFFIARRATVETPKALASKIRSKLREPRIVQKTSKRGKISQVSMTFAEVIVHARRRQAGEQPLKRAEAKKIATTMINKRVRAAAFLKSGWLAAIRKLEPLSDRRGIPRQDKSGKQFGRPKGFAKPAQESWRVSCLIQNDALPKGKSFWKRMFGGGRDSAMKIAGPALQRAFDFEVKSMKDYLARKLQKTAQDCGIKTR
jgi:hypothetical protein